MRISVNISRLLLLDAPTAPGDTEIPRSSISTCLGGSCCITRRGAGLQEADGISANSRQSKIPVISCATVYQIHTFWNKQYDS